jgi:hypothetical protein
VGYQFIRISLSTGNHIKIIFRLAALLRFCLVLR